jgi:hypothetical protein
VVSVDSLLDGHEVGVRARVDELREEAARVAAALGEAELALEHVVITRATLAMVVADHGAQADVRQHPDTAAPSAAEDGAGPVKVPAWQAGLDERALPVGYRRLWTVLAGATEAVRAQDAARALGFDPVPAKVEGARSKLKRLVRCGWLVESAPGAFQTAVGVPGTVG